MGRSITEGLYLSPQTRNGADTRISESEVKDLDDDAVLYSIRGAAPEGWYNAGTKKHATKGSGYEDHQIFKKLPTNSPVEKNEPIEEKKADKNKDKVKPKTQDAVAPSQEVTDAKNRAAAYDPNSFGIYRVRESAFAERSKEVFNPNEGFQPNQQTSVSTNGNENAQSFMKDKLDKTKKEFNFQPTLS